MHPSVLCTALVPVGAEAGKDLSPFFGRLLIVAHAADVVVLSTLTAEALRRTMLASSVCRSAREKAIDPNGRCADRRRLFLWFFGMQWRRDACQLLPRLYIPLLYMPSMDARYDAIRTRAEAPFSAELRVALRLRPSSEDFQKDILNHVCSVACIYDRTSQTGRTVYSPRLPPDSNLAPQ